MQGLGAAGVSITNTESLVLWGIALALFGGCISARGVIAGREYARLDTELRSEKG
jgi:hypothetical protein